MEININRRPTAEEVSALKGHEFIMTFTKDNGKELCGLTSSAYVAQADINKGITIMGTLPHVDGFTDHEEDVILQCCNCHGEPDNPKFHIMLWQYMDMIVNGNPLSVDGSNDGLGVYGMAFACPF